MPILEDGEFHVAQAQTPMPADSDARTDFHLEDEVGSSRPIWLQVGVELLPFHQKVSRE